MLVKDVLYDSFGNVIQDSAPHFFLPLGFAGGAADRWTGLARFGHRDYDPESGRFTACDPLGDTGGDHDLYEYCVDDPINAVDPRGLNPDAARTIKKGTAIIKGNDFIEKVTAIPEFKKTADDAQDSIREETKKIESLGPPTEDNWEDYENHPDILGRLFREKGGSTLQTGAKIAKP